MVSTRASGLEEDEVVHAEGWQAPMSSSESTERETAGLGAASACDQEGGNSGLTTTGLGGLGADRSNLTC